MKITSIKRQKKRTDRYSIYVDGKYVFSVSEPELISLGIYQNKELTEAELEELQAQSVFGKAYDRASGYLSIRPRSRFEMETYLRRKDYDSETIARIVARLEELELLDDREFARKWVEWRQSSRPRSRRKLQAELAQKRIPRDIVDEALGAVDDEMQLQNLRELIEKKRKRYPDRQKLIAYLARQGYRYDLIKQALDDTV